MEVLFIVSRRMERNVLVGEPGNWKKVIAQPAQLAELL